MPPRAAQTEYENFRFLLMKEFTAAKQSAEKKQKSFGFSENLMREIIYALMITGKTFSLSS